MIPKHQIIGAVLFVLFMAQDALGIKWDLMESWQADQAFKRWSGLFLFLTIVIQWLLSGARLWSSGQIQSGMLTLHKYIGALAPILYYVHATTFGYGYLLYLSLFYFGNILIGLVNTQAVKSLGMLYFRFWFLTHVLISLFILTMSIWHIWIVFYYE